MVSEKRERSFAKSILTNIFRLKEQLTDYIWTTLLDPIAYRAHCLKETIINQLEDDLTRRKYANFFYYLIRLHICIIYLQIMFQSNLEP